MYTFSAYNLTQEITLFIPGEFVVQRSRQHEEGKGANMLSANNKSKQNKIESVKEFYVQLFIQLTLSEVVCISFPRESACHTNRLLNLEYITFMGNTLQHGNIY